MKLNVKGRTEFERFDNTIKKLLSVPHSEIQAKLDAEKKAKARKKTRKMSPVKSR
jgi:hypothetical protein